MTPLRHAGPIALTLVALLCAAAVEAAEIYRWTDKQGQAHFSDVVPPEYKNVAKPMTVAPPASLEDQDRAVERAANERYRAAPAPAPAPAPAIASPRSASSSVLPATAPPASKRPPMAPAADTDCDTWRRLYRESLACFGPYRTARGGTKAEAFDHCTPVTEPPIRCGRDTH